MPTGKEPLRVGWRATAPYGQKGFRVEKARGIAGLQALWPCTWCAWGGDPPSGWSGRALGPPEAAHTTATARSMGFGVKKA